MKKLILPMLLCVVSGQAETHPLQALIEAARTNSPQLKSLFATTVFDLKERGAAVVWGQDFLFVIETDKIATVALDGQPAAAMTRIPDSNIWYRLTRMRLGITHNYHFYADGNPLPNAYKYDVAGYGADSYPQPGVPKGTLSEKNTLTSKIYPGFPVSYWAMSRPATIRLAALRSWSGRMDRIWRAAISSRSGCSPSRKTCCTAS